MFIWSVVHSLQRLTKHCSPQAIHKRAIAPTTAVRITHLCIHTYAISSYILVHSHTSTERLSKIFALHCILAYTCTHTNYWWWWCCCCCSVEKTREHNTYNIHPVGSAIGCRLRAHFMEIISWYINRRMLTPSVLSLGLYASDWDSCVACCAEKHTHYRIQDEPMIHTVKLAWERGEIALVFWYTKWRGAHCELFQFVWYIWIKMRHSIHWFQMIWHHVPSHPTIRIRDTFHICIISNSIDWHSFGVFRFLLVLLFVWHFWKICLLLKLQMIFHLNGSACSGTWHDAPHFSWSND